MRRTFACAAAALLTVVSSYSIEILHSEDADAPQRSVPSSPERQIIMRSHYFQLGEIHDGLIRGDIKAIQTAAQRLAALSPATPVAAQFAPFVTAMKAGATRVAAATTIDAAAKATTEVLSQCAGCHRTAGIRPTSPSRATPDVGGMVGHMLEHQRATDALVLGLLLPSASEWEMGAGLLDTGELRPNELPRDPKMTQEARRADEKVHALASDAMAANTPASRDAVYTGVVTACAQCHSLHPTIWGPRATAP